jgi:spoIIIJ-associated protein
VVESVEATGRSVDEAIENALDELGLEREDVTIEVLAPATEGRAARVRVTPHEGIELDDEYDDEDEDDEDDELEEDEDLEEEEDEDEEEDEEDAPAVVVPPRVPPQRQSRDLVMGQISDEARPVAEGVVAVVNELLDHMDLASDVEIDAAEIEDGLPTVQISIHGEYGGILIGRRGDTLSALQFLVGLIASRRAERRIRVILDAEGYRDRRARLLRDIALRAAERAQRYRQPIFLDPMLPGERRIVHMTLADHPGVSTHSVGEGDSRRVVVSPRQAQRFGGYGAR